MIELAEAGNVRCLEYCLERLLPKRSGRPLDLKLPAIGGVRDVLAAMAAVTTALNDGDVTAEEATHLVRWFEGYAKIIEAHDLEARIEALKSQMKEKGNDLTPSQRITKTGMGSND